MAPTALSILPRNSGFSMSYTSNALREQWTKPSDVFNVLLILGGDVITRALAQLAGSGFAPVTFSFGSSYHSHLASLLFNLTVLF